jgi:hypothetical protein
MANETSMAEAKGGNKTLGFIVALFAFILLPASAFAYMHFNPSQDEINRQNELKQAMKQVELREEAIDAQIKKWQVAKEHLKDANNVTLSTSVKSIVQGVDTEIQGIDNTYALTSIEEPAQAPVPASIQQAPTPQAPTNPAPVPESKVTGMVVAPMVQKLIGDNTQGK